MLVSVLMIYGGFSIVRQSAGKVTSRTAKRDVRRRWRSGETEERSGRRQRVRVVAVLLVLMLVVWTRVMVVVAVLVRVMKTGRVAAIVGVGVIIAKHRTKAGRGVVRMPSILTAPGK